MKRFFAVSILIMLLALPGVSMADEPASGTIVGQVVNGSEDGGSVVDLDVTLFTFVDRQLAEEGTLSTTDSDGKFRFSDLATDTAHAYRVLVRYQGVEYPSEPIVFPTGETDRPVGVTVFETTTSEEAVKVALAHTIIKFEEDVIVMTEVFQFINEGDRTFIGSGVPLAHEERSILTFSLPPGSTNVDAPMGLIQVDDMTLVDVMPFIPGNRQVVYSYSLPRPDLSEYVFSLQVGYPTDKLDVMIQGEGIEAASDQLTTGQSMGDVEFIRLTGQQLSRGEILEIRLSGLSKGSGTTVYSIGSTIAAVVILIIIVYLLRRKRTHRVVVEVDDIEAQKRQLMQEIAMLDDAFAEGKIAENVYQYERSEKKAQLMRLLQRANEGTPDG